MARLPPPCCLALNRLLDLLVAARRIKRRVRRIGLVGFLFEAALKQVVRQPLVLKALSLLQPMVRVRGGDARVGYVHDAVLWVPVLVITPAESPWCLSSSRDPV